MTVAEIIMTMPAESRFVATARVTAASLAAELDFAVDRIEALQAGANELVSLLIEWADDHGGDRIELTYGASADSLSITARVLDPAGTRSAADGPEADAPEAEDPDADDPVGALDDLTRQILDAVVDEFDFGPGRGRIVKLRAAG